MNERTDFDRAAQPVLSKLIDEILASVPEDWREVTWIVRRVDNANKAEYEHTASGPAGEKLKSSPSESVHALAHELAVIAKRHGQRWTELTLRMRAIDAEQWDYRVHFRHED